MNAQTSKKTGGLGSCRVSSAWGRVVEKGLERALDEQSTALPLATDRRKDQNTSASAESCWHFAAMCSSHLPSPSASSIWPPPLHSSSLPPIHLKSGSRRLFHLLPLCSPSSLHSPDTDLLSPLGAHCLPTHTQSHFFLLLYLSSTCCHSPPSFTVPHFPPAFPPTSGSCFSLSDLSYSLTWLLQNPLILLLGWKEPH